MAEKAAANKNEKVGLVVSTKMAKTIVVEVTRRVPHPLYKRIVTKRKKFYAHDETSQAKLGDTVRIVERRPLSKLKRWALGEVVRAGRGHVGGRRSAKKFCKGFWEIGKEK